MTQPQKVTIPAVLMGIVVLITIVWLAIFPVIT